jgi:HPt (histidine-containing phosphotransfer) domain-containing protein
MKINEDRAIAVTDPFARRLMVQYLERRGRDSELLSAALADSDFDTIESIGHKLFGSGSAYGLDEVTRLGGELERAAQASDATSIAALISAFEAYVQQLKLS